MKVNIFPILRNNTLKYSTFLCKVVIFLKKLYAIIFLETHYYLSYSLFNFPEPASDNQKAARIFHDKKGLLVIGTQDPVDLCDCLRLDCHGCQWPCPDCGGHKSPFARTDETYVEPATVGEVDHHTGFIQWPLNPDQVTINRPYYTMPLKFRCCILQVPRVFIGRERMPTSGNSGMRTAILVWLTLQNSIHTLLIRYSRARVVEEMFLSTVAVFLAEVIKCVICLLLVAQEETPQRFFSTLMNQVVRQPYDTLKVCIPAMIYIVQNNLFYVAASHLDAATFMITSQLKIFTAAIFTVIILRRSLSSTQWVALGILFVGVSLVQLQSSASSAASDSLNQRPLVGFASVLVACILSGFAGIYFEKILKGAAPVSLWMRNVQMGVFAIPSSFIGVMVNDGEVVREHGLLYGFDSVVWLTVLWYGIGGLSVAVCIKYADNIAKNFATSVAIILSTIGSMYLFGFVPSAAFLFGAGLVIFSIFMYSSTGNFLSNFTRHRGSAKSQLIS
ncbi:hypothetical protein WR25_15731 [Diploscapter pachys]|uniref:ARF7 effector protein C-terminal domain-containing protein n=1 Tax=Diploscapter pachys TaxID=2018661 RepID=A0A2A2J411_9BILA|nr:hypothetical protein WR25_15731 [Diploscapter pachys]